MSPSNLFHCHLFQHAGQERAWTELAQVYIEMKTAGVDIDDNVLQSFISAFTSDSPDNTGGGFDSFLKELQLCLEGMHAVDQPDQSPSVGLDATDQLLVGKLGVELMFLCLRTQRQYEGYAVLHSLHECNINYSQCGGAVGLHKEIMSQNMVALMAVEICLGVVPMQCNSALEVLRGSNYALPTEDLLLPEEAEKRQALFHTLHQNFLEENKFDLAYELLQQIGDANKFGVGPQKSMYNAFLMSLIAAEELDKALDVLEEMEAYNIPREPENIRALVDGLGNAGRTLHAKKLFLGACDSGVYPASFFGDHPWTVVVRTSFSALEAQLYLEQHLNRLHEFTEKRLLENALYEDEKVNPLRVVIMTDEAPRLYSGYMANEEIVCRARYTVLSVLTNDFNPPFSCTTEGNDVSIVPLVNGLNPGVSVICLA